MVLFNQTNLKCGNVNNVNSGDGGTPERLKKVLVAVSSPSDATSFYRSYGPWNALRKAGKCEILPIPNDMDWWQMQQADVLFINRAYSAPHRRLIQMAVAAGLQVIVDYDDDLTAVPRSNRAHTKFSEAYKHLPEIIRMASAVWVSTPALQRVYDLIGASYKAVVVPNAYQNELFPYATQGRQPDKVVLYRGSDTHSEDIASVADRFEEVICNNPDWKFVFMHFDPFAFRTFRRWPDNIIHVPGCSILDYHRAIYDMRPSIVTHPLVANEFNMGKSNIAWIEATHAGAVCLAPAFPEWLRHGCRTYHDPSDFGRCLQQLMTESYLPEIVEASRRYIAEHLTLSKVNELRFASLTGL